ncbi:MAG TPA: TolC family protein, partial [Gammaproteobacteria bacterium]|nr:TolC family protein [Gammaproteobacteria bacterium]
MAVSNWIGTVLIGNPDVQAGQAAVDAALARASAADQPLFNPELEFDYERTDINISSLGLSQTIDWSNKRGAHKAIAEVGVRAARVELS